MTDSKDSTNRDFIRVPYAAMVMVVRDHDAWVCELKDLSPGGCGIFRPDECTLREADIVMLYFYERVGPAITVGARVAHIGPTSIGLEYHEIQQVPPVNRNASKEAGA